MKCYQFIFGCDPYHSPPLVMGNNVHLGILGTDQSKLKSYYNQPAESGRINMLIEKQFSVDLIGRGKQELIEGIIAKIVPIMGF